MAGWCEHNFFHACPCHKLCPFGIRRFPLAPGPPTFRAGLFFFSFSALSFSEAPAFYRRKVVLAWGKELWTWTWEAKRWSQDLLLTDYWCFRKKLLSLSDFNIDVNKKKMSVSLSRVIVRMISAHRTFLAHSRSSINSCYLSSGMYHVEPVSLSCWSVCLFH